MVTAASGKGISVCEMLIANQRKETVRACLEFFQASVGRNITESFVIDKDFTEWSVLSEVYPTAKAVKKKLLAFDIPHRKREGFEKAFHAMIYARSNVSFEEKWEKMKAKCAKHSPGFAVYLKKNWLNCKSRWADHLRGHYFCAGNTTTNRLEATWKQMKRLVNLNTTMDKCLDGVLLYQNASMRELRSDLVVKNQMTHFNSRDPDELASIGNATSTFVYKRVYERYNSYLKRRKGIVVVESSHDEVTLRNGKGAVFRARFDGRSCSCMDFAGIRLPCVHIMFANLDVKKAVYLSADLVVDRWSYAKAADMVHVLRSSIQSNKELRDLMSSIRSLPVRRSPLVGTVVENAEPSARIHYEYLRKNELQDGRSIVRSDVEKFNMATALFQPLVDVLVDSSSWEFYKRMNLVSVACSDLRLAMKAIEKPASRDNHEADLEGDGDGGSDSTLDLRSCSYDSEQSIEASNGEMSGGSGERQSEEDLHPTAEEVAPASSETSEQVDDLVEQVLSGIVGPLEIGAAESYNSTITTTDAETSRANVTSSDSVTGIDETTVNSVVSSVGTITVDDPPTVTNPILVTVGEASTVVDNIQLTVNESPTQITQRTVAAIPRAPKRVQLKLPQATQSGKKNNVRRRKTTRHLNQPRLAMSVEIAQDTWHQGVPVAHVLNWLQHTAKNDKIDKMLRAYPRVLTAIEDYRIKPTVTREDFANAEQSLCVVFSKGVVDHCVEALSSAYKRAKVKGKPSVYCGYAVRVTRNGLFHQQLIYTMQDFHRYRATFMDKMAAYKWLKTDWSAQECYRLDTLSVPGKRESELAGEVMTTLNFTNLSAYVEIPLLNDLFAAVQVGELFGTLAGTAWLTDTPITMMAQKLCGLHGNAFYVNSLDFGTKTVQIKHDTEHSWEWVIAPCHVGGCHWTLIAINLAKSQAAVFDPLRNSGWTQETAKRLTDVLLPAVEEWRFEHFGKDQKPWPKWTTTTNQGPRQEDSNNCGVFVLAMVWCYLQPTQNEAAKQRGAITTTMLKALRLRILWHLLCAPDCRVINPAADRMSDVAETEVLLDKMTADLK
ncbi:hypothetical protein BBJ28_00022639 [Nothophytophthora sp. Chile5]|nr:hypothetical protein BBJ28_00022639 [Nothophytophthora sp. Chile5]